VTDARPAAATPAPSAPAAALDPADPAAQERYQVRFDVGLDGARRIGASAHLLVWCDAIAAEPVPVDALPHRLEVIDARLGAAGAIAQRLLALQAERGERTMVAVVAAGAPLQSPEGFPVEDVLLAGAVVDALGAVGIDATSPEAAAAAAAFQGLRGAVGHMLTASTAGRALAAASGPQAVAEARARLEEPALVVLREFSPAA
jgi:2-phosphosulfolactate phosphatase